LSNRLLLALVAALATPAQAASAFGHEPGWRAELGAKQLDFRADDGTRFALDIDARPQPGSPLQLGLQVRGEPLLLRTEVALCHDARTGQPFPWRISLTLSGKTYLGCGGEPALLLQGGDWRVLDSAVEQRLRFEADGRFSARLGCNRLSGSYRADADGFALSPGPMTRMACWGASDAAEARLLALLPQLLRFDIEADGVLRLRTLDGSSLRLTRAPSSP